MLIFKKKEYGSSIDLNRKYLKSLEEYEYIDEQFSEKTKDLE